MSPSRPRPLSHRGVAYISFKSREPSFATLSRDGGSDRLCESPPQEVPRPGGRGAIGTEYVDPTRMTGLRSVHTIGRSVADRVLGFSPAYLQVSGSPGRVAIRRTSFARVAPCSPPPPRETGLFRTARRGGRGGNCNPPVTPKPLRELPPAG